MTADHVTTGHQVTDDHVTTGHHVTADHVTAGACLLPGTRGLVELLL